MKPSARPTALATGLLLLATPLSLLFGEPQTDRQAPADPTGWDLVWSDEFDQPGAPDPEKWDYDVGGHGWGNAELQYYTRDQRENARVENGHLIIEARREEREGKEYTSARLVTRGKASWLHGRFEVRARLPEGRGTWAAMWMLPDEWSLGSGQWPEVGEIDIMEHVGFEPGLIHATVHSKKFYYKWNENSPKTSTIEIPDATSEFHTYAIEWTGDELRAYVDDTLYFTYANPGEGWESWPYTGPFHLLLNVAIGGHWGGQKGIDENAFPLRMEVDFVRVYQQVEK